MGKRSGTKYILFTIIIGLVCVFAAVSVCSRSVKGSLRTEMEKTLEDIARQNALAMRKEIVSKYRLLQGIAADLQDNPQKEEDILYEMGSFVASYNFKRMGYIHGDGMGHTTDGHQMLLGHRNFFQRSMEGELWLTGTVEDSRDKNESINVFSVPVYDKDGTEVMGVIFATYRNESFQDVMNVDFFDGRGFSCIIQQDGNVIVHSLNSPMYEESNFFEGMFGGSDEEAVQQMKSVMSKCEVGFGQSREQAQQPEMFYCYMPLFENDSTEPWYVVAMVPEQVLADRIHPVMEHVDRLTVFLLCIAAGGMAFYAYVGQRRKQELVRLAYDDNVTGGYNFHCFKEAAKKRRGIPGYLVAMDMSEFKVINSTRGVQKGDETLRELWRILLKHLKTGEIAGRVNADRFAIFFYTDDREVLVERLDALIEDITGLSETLNVPRLYPVFGIYFTNKVDETDECYGCAVQAKHLVKGRRDRHYAFYDEIDQNQVTENRKLEDRFEGALASGEFEVWYQPKYSAENGRVIGAEALVRWRRPDGRLLSPGTFIPLFEKNGYITVLDDYIFRSVCDRQKKWLDEGHSIVPVSVNISRVSLYFSNIVEKYAQILGDVGLESKYVQLEITESAMIDNTNIAHLIESFHEQGFAVLLDDFGSGYSSLSSLNTMQFDTLKLDKSLIDYIGDSNGEKLLTHITKLGQSLGIHITAEGVETQMQMEFLKNLGCDDIQGYFFSKPLPMEEYLIKLEN